MGSIYKRRHLLAAHDRPGAGQGQQRAPASHTAEQVDPETQPCQWGAKMEQVPGQLGHPARVRHPTPSSREGPHGVEAAAWFHSFEAMLHRRIQTSKSFVGLQPCHCPWSPATAAPQAPDPLSRGQLSSVINGPHLSPTSATHSLSALHSQLDHKAFRKQTGIPS